MASITWHKVMEMLKYFKKVQANCILVLVAFDLVVLIDIQNFEVHTKWSF